MSFLQSTRRTATTLNPSLLARAFSTTRASQLARMTLVGRLGNEPELNTGSTGKEYIRYVIGTDSGPRDNRTTSWFRVTSFAKDAQKEYVLGLQKGTLVYLEGDASMDVYEKDGQTRSSLNLIQTKIDVLKRPQPREDATTG